MFKKLISKIEKYNTIIIYRHQSPDGDALGSQFGLKEILKLNFPKKNIYVYGEPQELLDNNLGKIFKSFDKIPTGKYEESLSIILDTANTERICGNNWSKGKESFKIDHHPSTDSYADDEIILDKKSSTSEIISSLAKNENLKINKKTSTYLLVGMITDTGRFLYSSVDYETFNQASFLMKENLNISDINKKLNNRNLNFVRFQGNIQLKFKTIGNVAYYFMPKNFHKKYNIKYEIASSMIFLLMQSSDIEYGLFSSYDEEKNIWRTSLRSKKKPINILASKYNGGGHELAAGTKLERKSELKILLKDLIELSKK